jgi:hypothetical protein
MALTVDRSCTYGVLVGRPKGKRQLRNIGVNGRIILKWTFKMWNEEAWTGLAWLRIGTGERCLSMG